MSRMYDATGTSETGLTNYGVYRLQTTGTLAGSLWRRWALHLERAGVRVGGAWAGVWWFCP
jgi:hypothetical protein